MSAGPAHSKRAGVDAGLWLPCSAPSLPGWRLGRHAYLPSGVNRLALVTIGYGESVLPPYTQLIAWQEDVNTWALGRARPAAPRPDLLGRELHAQLLIFAGDAVLRWLEQVETQLERAAPPRLPRSSDNPESQLHAYAEALLDAIQQEFVKGRARSWKE